MADTVRFDARIETITFYNADNNYHIMKFSTTSQLEGLKYEYGRYQGTLVGYCVTCVEGDRVTVEGEYTIHPQFGPQYKIVSLGFDKPENADQLYTFLSAILTPNQAKMLYTYYPDIVDSVINDNNFTPDLRPLKGIGESSWKRIRDKIIADFCYKDLITLLAPCDVTLLMIHNIAEHFKIKDMNLLREKIIQNPYILYQVSRLGFKKVDAYALKLDPNLENSLQRARACIEYILTNFAEMDGHSYIPISLLNDEFKKTISGKEIFEKMQEVLDEQREKYINGTPDFLYVDDENVGLIMYYRMENHIRDKLLEISQTNNFWNISYKDFFERMESTAQKQGFYLSDEQSEVVRSITENNITVLSGKAGCGKSSAIKAVLEVYKDKRIAMAALSAKAAKRMREVTEKYASTIHMLLGYENGGFVHNEDNLLPCDLLIIDECSMNNIHLFHSLLKATSKYTKILFCGDFAQVPSIGVGAVFTDLINTNVFNNHNLTKVYRQSEDSYIVEHANIVREGIMPFDITTGNMPFGNDTVYFFRTQSEDIQDLSVGIFIKFLEQGVPLNDLAIVVPRKETVAVSCEKINNLIQDALFDEDVLEISNNNKTKTFKLGCRVINKKNDYKKGVLNGDTGIVTSIDVKKGEFYVTLEDDRTILFTKGDMANVELGYAITVHSAQGSQYKNCIVALDMSSYTLLSANMIYTAMTRAVNKLIVISQPSAFCKAVTNMKENNRYTWLKSILTEEDKINILLHKKEQVKDNIVTIEEDKIFLPERNEVYNGIDEDPFWDEPLPF